MAIGEILGGIGALIGAGSSLIGGIGANQAAGDSVALGRENLDFQKSIAERLLKQAFGTLTDAEGNVTSYNQDTGATNITPSSANKSIIDANAIEALKRLTTDSGMVRNDNIANSGLRSTMRDASTQFTKQAMAPSSINSDSLAAMLRDQARKDVNDTFQTTERNVGNQAMRSGSSNAGNIIAQLAKQKQNEMSSATTDATLRGLTTGSQLETDRVNRNTGAGINFGNAGMGNPTSVALSDVGQMITNTGTAKSNTIPQAAGVGVAGTANAGNALGTALGKQGIGNSALGKGVAGIFQGAGNLFDVFTDNNRRANGNTNTMVLS